MTHRLDLTQNERDFLIDQLRNRKDDVEQFNGMHSIHKFTILRKLETPTAVPQFVETDRTIEDMLATLHQDIDNDFEFHVAIQDKEQYGISATLDMLDRWGR